MPLFGIRVLAGEESPGGAAAAAFQRGAGQAFGMAAKAQELQQRQQALELDSMQTAANVENIAARTQAQLLDNEIQEATKPFDIAEAQNRARQSEIGLAQAEEQLAFDQSVMGRLSKFTGRMATVFGNQRKIAEDRIAVETAQDEQQTRLAELEAQRMDARLKTLDAQTGIEYLRNLGQLEPEEVASMVGPELIGRATEILNSDQSDEIKGSLIKALEQERLRALGSYTAERAVDFSEKLRGLSSVSGHLPEDINQSLVAQGTAAFAAGKYPAAFSYFKRAHDGAVRTANNRRQQSALVMKYSGILDSIEADPEKAGEALGITIDTDTFNNELVRWRESLNAFIGRDPKGLGPEDFQRYELSWQTRFATPEVIRALRLAGITAENTPIPGDEDEVFNFQQFMNIDPQADPLGGMTTGAGSVDLSLED
jgi:tetratricopeptide (TPR) repeat protein